MTTFQSCDLNMGLPNKTVPNRAMFFQIKELVYFSLFIKNQNFNALNCVQQL